MLAPILVAATLAAGPSITRDTYKLYKDYLDALSDPRVEKMKPRARLPAIARNFGVPQKKIEAAIKAGERAGGPQQVEAEQESALRAALAPVLGDRVKSVKVDTSAGHVVTYVEWAVGKQDQLDEEAAAIAAKTFKSAPVTSTLALWSVDASGAKVYEGKIAWDAARNIDEARIPDFADRMYSRLFEGRRNAYDGQAAQ